MDWLTDHKIPLGKWIKSFVDLLLDHAAWFFDFLSELLEFPIEGLTALSLALPPLLLVAAIAALAFWLHRSWKLVAAVVLTLLLVVNLGYWETTVQTLVLILFSTAVCILVGVPVGIAAAHRPWLYNAIRPVLDLMQTIPTFVYLIPTMIMFGLGVVPGLISTVVFAIPAPIRLTHLGISSVPRPLVEAGEAFGATRRQLLWKVELPHAMPTIMAGVTQCIMLSLSMVVIAAMVGAPGLGVPVLRALNTVNIAKGFEAGLAIVIVAILLDRICKQPGGGRDRG
ncbi:MAG: choline ABC transporter permease subunit [Alphaproteobacteria bacterium]|nr:choline ABC transporter permease subunit [Alphaproteobacteria bacterium]MDE0410169.1 choline ABC transporter permease subunit [Alphaproteobacteria bacterium]